MSRFLILFPLLICLAATPLHAAPPAVTTLFPAGAARGTTVDVKVGGTIGTQPVSVWCDRSEFQFAWDEQQTVLKVTVSEQAEPGVAWLRLHNAEGASSLKPFFVGHQPELNEREPNDEPAKASPIAGTVAVVNGVLAAPSDVDTFAISAKRGQTIVACMEANRTLGSPMDAVLQILSPAGDVLEQNDDYYGIDPLVTAEAAVDGTYFVRTFAFPAQANSSVRFSGGDNYIYRLTVTTGGFATHTLPLVVERGSKISAALAGWNLAPESFAIDLVADADERESLASFPEHIANVLTPRIIGHSSLVEREPNGRDAPQAVAWPCSVTGTIAHPGDVDVFRIEAKKGDRLIVRAEARTFGSALDPVIRFRNADGTLVKENDDLVRDMYEAELEQVIAADGSYLVEVIDLYGHGGFDFPYLLTIVPALADFELTVAADAFVLPAGQPLEIPVNVNRLNRHADSIEIVAEGLPDGVTAQTVISEGKGATVKSVKLKLEGTPAEPFSGPFRIVGRSKSSDVEQVRVSRGTVAGATARTEHLWLTALKP